MEYDPFNAKVFKARNRIRDLFREFNDNSVYASEFSSDTSLIYLILKSNLSFSDEQIGVVLGLDFSIESHRSLFKGIRSQTYHVAEELYSCTRFDTLLEYSLTDIKEICYFIATNFKPLFFIPIMKKISTYCPPDSARSGSSLSTFHGRSTGYHNTVDSRSSSRGSLVLSSLASYTGHHGHISSDISGAAGNGGGLFLPVHNHIDQFGEVIQYISKFNQMWIVAILLNREYNVIAKRYDRFLFLCPNDEQFNTYNEY